MVEVAKDAVEFNLPIIRSNRRLVASENGGLHNPSCLVFNPEWTHKHVDNTSKRFQYPALPGIRRPKSEEDIAFMSVRQLLLTFWLSIVLFFLAHCQFDWSLADT